jgi:SAM-dependent methyltransferase
MPNSEASSPFKALERDGWHVRASHYDTYAGRITAQAVPPVLAALALRIGDRLLETCCGPAYLTAAAATAGADTVGLDIAPGMVEEARRRNPGLRFEVGDAEALSFPDECFDAVACLFGLIHMDAPERAAAEAWRVLRPGGRFAFTAWTPPPRGAFLSLFFAAIAAHADLTVPLPPAPPFFHFGEPENGLALLAAGGFADGTATELPLTYRGPDAEAVLAWFHGSTVRARALFDLQTPEVQDRIEAAICAYAAAATSGDGGGIELPSPAMLYVGRKPLT